MSELTELPRPLPGKARRFARGALSPHFVGHLFGQAHQVTIDEEKAGEAMPATSSDSCWRRSSARR